MKNRILLIAIAGLSGYSCEHQYRQQAPTLEFVPLSYPATRGEQQLVRISPGYRYTDASGKTLVGKLNYELVHRSGDRDAAGNVMGRISGINGKTIKTSNKPDGNAILQQDGQVYLFTNYEEAPGAVYQTVLKGNQRYTAGSFRSVDFSSLEGTVRNCASTTTPWHTVLSAEENIFFDSYFFDPATAGFSETHISKCDKSGKWRRAKKAQRYLCRNASSMVRKYLGLSGISQFNPYNYGYHVEIAVNTRGDPVIRDGRKRLALGSLSPELAIIMPDQRATYISSDGANRPLMLFLADRMADLSSGTLYIARWKQKDDQSADIDWIRLGHANDQTVKKYIDRRPMLSDLFDIRSPDHCKAEQGYRYLVAGTAGRMCLRLRDGSHGTTISAKFNNAAEVRQAVAFLEPIKYGAYLGGTTEYNKTEGITLDPVNRVLYQAVSFIRKGMTDNYRHQESANHIRFKKNKCGGVIAMKMGKKHDESGIPIGSEYVVNQANLVLQGKPLTEGDLYADKNACHPDSVANPDNLRYIGHDTLLIGEDTQYHFNNAVFAFNVKTKKLTRIMTAPVGSEFTGMFAPLSIPGNGTRLFVNVQHPYVEKALNAAGENVNSVYLKAATKMDKRAYVGYINGLPDLPVH